MAGLDTTFASSGSAEEAGVTRLAENLFGTTEISSFTHVGHYHVNHMTVLVNMSHVGGEGPECWGTMSQVTFWSAPCTSKQGHSRDLGRRDPSTELQVWKEGGNGASGCIGAASLKMRELQLLTPEMDLY